MFSDYVGVPLPLLDRPVERWARWCYDRPADPDVPSTEIYEGDVAWLLNVEDAVLRAELAGKALERFAELHERYSEWTPHYSAAQLSQGLSVFFVFPCNFEILLQAEELPFSLRERAMRSLVVPYEVYVKGWDPNESMPFAWDMLWDNVLSDSQSADIDMSVVALECLRKILALDDVRCQAAALHGLNHLAHPERAAIVQHWMDERRGEDWNWQWVEACRDGTAM